MRSLFSVATLLIFSATAGPAALVTPSPEPAKVTVHDQAVPFAVALRQLTNLAPSATNRREGNIYLIGMRPPPGTTPRITTGLVELELPPGATEKMSFEGDHLISGPSGLEVSGRVRIQLSSGARLTTEDARVRVLTDKTTGMTRIRVEPVPASRAP